MSGDEAWPYRLQPEDYGSLRFSDFPGGSIEDVADHLYQVEPNFMRALETDVQAIGVIQPVELGNQDTIMDGHHRLAAAFRASVPVPVAFYGEDYPVDRAEQDRWETTRYEHRQEYDARMYHDPGHWVPATPDALDLEAGQ